eukprot:CAMPEP_0181293562 /NCGR_PEP_ID=MMETSP1101-20121128/3131_1 /TAXON_ID=46948 /ORGANISM="Rhodomonas abbreviata, Strain Caron Lab Isolate" /LENGTH=30 /DNA_ID= /DNA_START= /DNA_END= /DNA_ORIENTATION=
MTAPPKLGRRSVLQIGAGLAFGLVGGGGGG